VSDVSVPTATTSAATSVDGTAASSSLLDSLKAQFPWLDQIGLTPQFFQHLVATSASPDEIITTLRQQPQYRARFAGLWRPDGSLRMTEAQYLNREQDYRTVLKQYGYGQSYTDAQSLVGFFDSEMDPNELKDRLDTFKKVQDSGQHVKDAFYVYAGLDVTDEQLYQAMVDPAAAQHLQDQYNAKVASQSFDYQTWITRATERGLQRVSDTLGQLQKSGALTGEAVQTVLRTDPNFARSIMDALYTNAGQPGQQLQLQDLISSFEQAAIGAAATQAGLTMPTKERVAELRAAGVDRAAAQRVYGQYGQGVLDDAVRRATGQGLTQGQVEDAAFLGDGKQQLRVQQGLAAEAAAGAQQGQFDLQMNRQGRFVQQGLRQQV